MWVPSDEECNPHSAKGGLSKRIHQSLIVQPAESLLTQRRPGAVPNQLLQPMAIPIWYGHRGIDRPTAGVVCIVHGVNGKIIKMTVAMQPTQASFAHLYLNCEKIIIIKIKCGMKLGLTILAGGKTPSVTSTWKWTWELR